MQVSSIKACSPSFTCPRLTPYIQTISCTAFLGSTDVSYCVVRSCAGHIQGVDSSVSPLLLSVVRVECPLQEPLKDPRALCIEGEGNVSEVHQMLVLGERIAQNIVI